MLARCLHSDGGINHTTCTLQTLQFTCMDCFGNRRGFDNPWFEFDSFKTFQPKWMFPWIVCFVLGWFVWMKWMIKVSLGTALEGYEWSCETWQASKCWWKHRLKNYWKVSVTLICQATVCLHYVWPGWTDSFFQADDNFELVKNTNAIISLAMLFIKHSVGGHKWPDKLDLLPFSDSYLLKMHSTWSAR